MRPVCSRLLVQSKLMKNVQSRFITSTTGLRQENQTSSATTAASTAPSEGGQAEKGSISKAMHAYLERAKEHNEFMRVQQEEFALGRRHLANMMGKDPETFTQEDINEAIRYLFPSGLFQLKARPMMKPPEELYPKQKAAEFDASGRPHHPFFYTAKPNFFYLLHDIVNKMNSLNVILAAPGEPSEEAMGLVNGTKWISKEDLETRLLEKINDVQYNEWVNTMDRLVGHKHFEKEFEFIKQYRVPLSSQSLTREFPPLTLEADGTKSVTITNCGKKTARGQVTVRMPGTGRFKINGKELDYFSMIQSREMVIAPLQRVKWLGTVDVEAEIQGGGESSQAVSLRYGVANGIAALGADAEVLRLAGYLTHDRRRKERSHVGCVGARAKWTWKKR